MKWSVFWVLADTRRASEEIPKLRSKQPSLNKYYRNIYTCAWYLYVCIRGSWLWKNEKWSWTTKPWRKMCVWVCVLLALQGLREQKQRGIALPWQVKGKISFGLSTKQKRLDFRRDNATFRVEMAFIYNLCLWTTSSPRSTVLSSRLFTHKF